jgi:hypothetical protein
MWGVSELAVGEPSRMAVLLSSVGLLETETSFDPHRAIARLRVASEIAAQRGAHQPTDYLVEAAAELARAGFLDDSQSVVADVRAKLDDDYSSR